MLLFLIEQDVSDSPALIERNPRNDAGMIAVSRNHLSILMQQRVHAFLAELIIGRHLLPHENSHMVRQIQENRILDFLVLPYAVKAHGADHLQILKKRLAIRRRHEAVRPVSLVENQALVQRKVIK